MRVVQHGGRLGLVAEALQAAASSIAANGSTFSATRRPSESLLGFVDDAHAAAADLAEDAEVAQDALGRLAGGTGGRSGSSSNEASASIVGSNLAQSLGLLGVLR